MDSTSFHNPPKPYGEVPFWSWNDKLEPDELRRQIGLMDDAGWGGFFMHSRVGLQTPYLGKQWMECIRACIEEAAKRGMDAWLYDEDKWPSGFAGGLAAVDPSHRPQVLVCLVDNKPALLREHLAAFSAQRDASGSLSDFKALVDLPGFDGDTHSLVQFYVLHVTPGVTWFNGYSYIDVMNPFAVQAFLTSTHEVYAREVGDQFGKTIPGIFTDEPAYMSANIPDIGVVEPGSLQAVPWTEGLADLFLKRWGYDLLPHLISLFYDTGSYAQVRYHFWRLVTERFIDSYSKQIFDWCSSHNLKLTGHYLLEDNLWFQTRWIGAAMPHYEFEHIPGIDKLARNLFTPLTVKQLDSAVCQLGKPRALCESYGAAGQDLSFAGRKWIGDWLYVLGVTLNNPHLSLYSLRGERKRDHPANLFYQQPWWPENRLIADYFARLSSILSQGRRMVDILILHPMGSAWSRYRPDSTGTVADLDSALVNLEKELLSSQRDFHYGDEMLMEKYGRVVQAVDGPRLEVGKMQYQTVIFPPSHTWTSNTLRLVQEFAAAGGLILAVPPLPTEVEGVQGDRILPPGTLVVSLTKLARVLDEKLPFDVRISDAPDVWVHHRKEGKTDWYFLCNTSLDHSYKTTVTLNLTGQVESWDPATGEIKPLKVGKSERATEILLTFAPGGSYLLVVQQDELALKDDSYPPFDQHEKEPSALELADDWNLLLEGPNMLTLDTAEVKIGQSEWSQPMYILDAHQSVKRVGTGTPFALRFQIDIAEVPQGRVFLAVESPEEFVIAVNDQRVPFQDLGWWVDISFRKLEISGCLVPGLNTVTLNGIFSNKTELESIYLQGSFGVKTAHRAFAGGSSGQIFYRYRPEFQITDLPETVKTGDLVPQGLPFFSGRARLSQTIVLERQPVSAVLTLTEACLALVKGSINGKEMGVAAWQPFEIQLGNSLREGKNLIELEVVSTLRNLLGPHHLKHGDGEGVGPGSFRMNPDWTEEYVFVPFGFGKAVLQIQY